jgi:hypothetical protein
VPLDCETAPHRNSVPKHHKAMILRAEFVRGPGHDRRRSGPWQTVCFPTNINVFTLTEDGGPNWMLKHRPEPVREPLPLSKHYEPPSKGRYRTRR